MHILWMHCVWIRLQWPPIFAQCPKVHLLSSTVIEKEKHYSFPLGILSSIFSILSISIFLHSRVGLIMIIMISMWMMLWGAVLATSISNLSTWNLRGENFSEISSWPDAVADADEDTFSQFHLKRNVKICFIIVFCLKVWHSSLWTKHATCQLKSFLKNVSSENSPDYPTHKKN